MKIEASIRDVNRSGREGNEFACLFFPFFPFPFVDQALYYICMRNTHRIASPSLACSREEERDRRNRGGIMYREKESPGGAGDASRGVNGGQIRARVRDAGDSLM